MTFLRSQLLEQTENSWSLGEWKLAEDIEFAPNFTANLGVNYRWHQWGLNLSGQHVGTMRLPFYDESTSEFSHPFYLIHGSVQRLWSARSSKRSGIQNTVTVGLKNLTNTVQNRPIIQSESPFSEDFDASRIYAPIERRRLFVKFAWSF